MLPTVVLSENMMPAYKTKGASGMDLRADIPTPILTRPGERVLVPTGVRVAIPTGCEGQVRPRSGLAFRHGLIAMLGTIDSDYRGEIGVLLINHGPIAATILPGERIAQLVISEVVRLEPVRVESLPETERGEGGFGSTGIV